MRVCRLRWAGANARARAQVVVDVPLMLVLARVRGQGNHSILCSMCICLSLSISLPGSLLPCRPPYASWPLCLRASARSSSGACVRACVSGARKHQLKTALGAELQKGLDWTPTRTRQVPHPHILSRTALTCAIIFWFFHFLRDLRE